MAENNYCLQTSFVYLFGKNLCPTCSPGQEVYNLSENYETVFIVPTNFSDNDIENFKNVFNIKGEIIRTNKNINNYMKRLFLCKRRSNSRNNCYVELNKERKISRIRFF